MCPPALVMFLPGTFAHVWFRMYLTIILFAAMIHIAYKEKETEFSFINAGLGPESKPVQRTKSTFFHMPTL